MPKNIRSLPRHLPIIQQSQRLRSRESIQEKQYPQGLGRYILGTTEGDITNDLQGSWENDHQLYCTYLEYKPTRHKLQKHPIYTERGFENCHWLSQDVQCRPPTRRIYYLHSIWIDVCNQEMSATITTRETPKRRMKETLFTRYRNTVEPVMLADNWKATLQAIHTDAVKKAVKDQKNNIVLDDLPHPINDSEKDLTRKEHATLAQLRAGYCKLLGSYKRRIKKDASLNVCADCDQTPLDVKHLFACPAHPTTLIPSDLWNKPMDSIPEFSYLEAGNLD